MKKRNHYRRDRLPEEDHLDLLAEDLRGLLVEDRLDLPAGDHQNAADHLGLLVEDRLDLPAGDRQNAEDHLDLPAEDLLLADQVAADRLSAVGLLLADQVAADHLSVEDLLLADQVAVDHLSVEDLLLADQVAVGHLSVEDHLEVRNVDHPADLSVDHQSEKLRINISTRFHYLEFYNVVNSKSFSVDLRLSNFQVELVPVH
jgi:hypothetical protein